MNYITVKLTEDQTVEVLRCLDDRMENLVTLDNDEGMTMANYTLRIKHTIMKQLAQAKS